MNTLMKKMKKLEGDNTHGKKLSNLLLKLKKKNNNNITENEKKIEKKEEIIIDNEKKQVMLIKNEEKYITDLKELTEHDYNILYIADDVLSKIATYLSLMDSLNFGKTCKILNGIVMNRSSSVVSLNISEIYRITKWYEYSKHFLDNFAPYYIKIDLKNYMNKILKKYSNIKFILFNPNFGKNDDNNNDDTNNVTPVDRELSSRFVFTLFPKLSHMKSFRLDDEFKAETLEKIEDIKDEWNWNKLYCCRECGNIVSNNEYILDKHFNGSTGTAYLFDMVYNIKWGDIETRYFRSGEHESSHVYCLKCNHELGWYYNDCTDKDQRYKIGKFCLELAYLNLYDQHNIIKIRKIQKKKLELQLKQIKLLASKLKNIENNSQQNNNNNENINNNNNNNNNNGNKLQTKLAIWKQKKTQLKNKVFNKMKQISQNKRNAILTRFRARGIGVRKSNNNMDNNNNNNNDTDNTSTTETDDEDESYEPAATNPILTRLASTTSSNNNIPSDDDVSLSNE